VLPTKREGPAGPPRGGARFEPVPGTVVAGKYRVEGTLGEGGMGIVVAATHLALEQHVAIKFLLPEAARNKVAVERFLREARVSAMVRSDYVARVHDVGTLEDGIPYIVMDHLEGSDLGKLIGRSGALPVPETSEIALQACEALAEVHAAGIVHRDLKPSNLFVTRRADGSPAVKLLDFGISKLTLGSHDSSPDPGLTATTTIMGSPSYMSPEQLKSTKEVDPRTDVWSLGAVLFEALSGKQAFAGDSVPQVCAMIASEKPASLLQLRPGLPADLVRAIEGCLEKDPDKRILLVNLAAVLARTAPARAKPLLERIEATLGMQATRPRADTAPRDLPVLPLATADHARSEWPQPMRKKRRSWAFRLLLLALLVGGGLVYGGLYAKKSGIGNVRGEIQGATSAVATAASVAASVASEAASVANLAASAANVAASAVASEVFEEPPVPDAGEPPEDAGPQDAGHHASKPAAGKPHPTKPRHPKLIHHKR
jgi:eukaryotic-like serine/threonine-protein kinase